MSMRIFCRACGMSLTADDTLCRRCGEFTDAEKRRLRYFGLLAIFGVTAAICIALFGCR